MLLFLSYSFGIETTNTFMHSLENHTRIQTKIGQIDQKGGKTIPFGAAHTSKANIREYLPRRTQLFVLLIN